MLLPSLALFRRLAVIAVLAVSLSSAVVAIRADDLVFTRVAGAVGVGGSADGAASDARFDYPYSIQADGFGNLYVGEINNHVIRKIAPTGAVTTLAGLAGSAGATDGTGSAARFNAPFGLAADATGNIYVADYWTCTIRRITPAGVVTTLAGSAGVAGDADGTGPAARFEGLTGLAIDSAGNLYATSSTSHTIRKITPAGVVTTFAGSAGQQGDVDGTGAAARFSHPYGIAVDANDNLYVTEASCVVRRITPAGVVTTLAGSPGQSGHTDGTGAAARFGGPIGIAVDPAGRVYVADSYNHTIRAISPAGEVTTVGGASGQSGSADGEGAAARFDFPCGLAVDGAGNLYVTDSANETIRMGVNSANTAPTISAIADATVNAGEATAALDFTVGDAESPAAGLLVTADSSNTTVVPPDDIVLGGSGANRTVTITGAAGHSGASTITLTVSDGALSTSTSFAVAVQASNAPTISSVADQTIDEDTATAALAFTVASTQTSTDNLVVHASSSDTALIPAGGITLGGSGADRTVALTPAANANGSATITLTVSDGTLEASTTFTVTVNAVNDAPTISAIPDQTVIGGSATAALAFEVGDVETLPGQLSVSATSSDTALVPLDGIALGGSGANRTVTLTPTAGLTGSSTITLTVSDGVLTAATSFTLTVAPQQGPAITSAGRTTFTAGVASSFTVQASGTPTPTYSATGLPDWITLDAQTGVLAGKAPAGTDGAQIALTVTAHNGIPPDASQALTIDVAAPPAITDPLLVSTVAGTAGQPGSQDGAGTAARFHHPMGLAVDAQGDVFVADADNHALRQIAADGTVTTVAGSGQAGSADGTGRAASFNTPTGVAIDSAGNLYVADTANHTIRKVTSAGAVTTLAGQAGSSGSTDGAGAAARFFGPQGVALDEAHHLLYIADTANDTLRKLDLTSGAVSTVAGAAGQAGSADDMGAAARFDGPTGLAIDADGNVLVADTENNAIRQVAADGTVTTLAGWPGSSGAADGTGTAARFTHPSAVAVDQAGHLFVLDADNQTVRRIVIGTGVVTTVAGQAATTGAADGSGSDARFDYPAGLATDTTGNLYIADTDNHTVRLGLFASAPTIQTQPQSQSVTAGDAVTFTVKADGRPTPTYQWRFNGAAISGATDATLKISSAQASDAGKYTVVVTNAAGSVTSNEATLDVTAKPTDGGGTDNGGSSGGGSGGGGGGGGAPSTWFCAAMVLLAALRGTTQVRRRLKAPGAC